MMFWQQSMGESVDLVVSPAPIHKHSGGMIQACYTQPAELEQRINAAVGRPFNLMNYWGPLANHRSSEWIVEAVAAVMEMPEKAPDLLFAYIPHLDYDLQRHGPGSPQASKALELLLGYLERLKAAAGERGYDWIIVGDYAIERAERAAFPNRALREAGLFGVREIAGMAYTDFFAGAAFAVCDHQFAHVHCRDQRSAEKASEVLRAIPGVAHVLTRAEQADWGLAHANSGELVLVAERGTWFAYPWFSRDEAPDYASHVDIHNKPGYDPCELFFGWPPGSVSFDTSKIRGTHGGNGKGMEAALATSLQLASQPESHIDVAREIRGWMERFPRL
jgi:predicted AlkP superfamily pyrophosphatase or phosphodiesterase